MKIIFNVTSSIFFNFQNVYSDEFPKFKSGTLEEIFLKKNLSRWKMGSENVHTYNMLTHQTRDLLIHSFHFLYIYSLLASSFFKICIVLLRHPIHHIRFEEFHVVVLTLLLGTKNDIKKELIS